MHALQRNKGVCPLGELKFSPFYKTYAEGQNWTESMSIPPGVLIGGTDRSGVRGGSSSRHTCSEMRQDSEWHHGNKASIHPLWQHLPATSPFPLNFVPHQERRAEWTLPNLLQHLVLLHPVIVKLLGSEITCKLDEEFVKEIIGPVNEMWSEHKREPCFLKNIDSMS